MRMIPKIILAGIGSIACAGAAGAVVPARHSPPSDIHILNVALADGSIREIRYRGDVPPRLIVIPVRVAAVQKMNADWRARLAMFDRMRASMDRQMAAMMRATAARPAARGTVSQAVAGGLPAGTVSYSYRSVSNGTSTCTRSVRMISYGEGQKPKVESQVAGNCTAAAPAAAAPSARSAPPAAPAKAAQPRRRPVDMRKTV